MFRSVQFDWYIPYIIIRYIRINLAAAQPDRSNSEINALREENAKLKERLAQYEGSASKAQTSLQSEQSMHTNVSPKADSEWYLDYQILYS